MSEAELAARSLAAVTGQVTQIQSAADTATGGVQTYIHLEPHSVVFGSLPAGPLVLREAGGQLRGASEWIFGSPEYRVGEEVLVFVSQNSDGTLRTTAMAMGKFALKPAASGVYIAQRHLGEGASVWDPDTGHLVRDPAPEEYDFDTLLDGLRAAKTQGVRPSISRRAVQTIPAELSRVPLTDRHESFTYINPASRWTEPDTGQPISYLIDGTGDLKVGASETRLGIRDAFAAWTNVLTSNLTLSDTGLLAQKVTFAGCSGGNRIMFNDPFNEITDPVGCSGILAIGGFCMSNETSTVGGTTYNRIRVGKITFNNGWSSCPGWNRCNLAEVATHELGHTLGFGHSTDANATMYATAHFDGRCASLRADDLLALNTVYPIQNNLGTSPTPTKTPLPPTSTATHTSVPTATQTLAPATATRTLAPSTATRTPLPSTATATRSPVPPTASPTRTSTAASTATATVPPTNTPDLGPKHTVRGRVHYYSTDHAVPDTTVNLTGPMHDATNTSASGDYEFDGVPAATWELAAQKQSDFGLGVTPLDAAYVLQAVANLRQIDATQRLACDVTGDGQLSALDATRILQFSVGMISHMPVAASCGSDWTFIPDPSPLQQQSIVMPSIAGGSCDAGKIMLDDLTVEAVDQNFRAILFGDCTGNWSPTANGTAAPSVRGGARMRVGRPNVDRDGVVRVPVWVRAQAPYSSLDLALAYDPALVTPRGVALKPASGGAVASYHAGARGAVRIAMASAQPINRAYAQILNVEFMLAPGARKPGDITGSAASVDEVPATLVGSVD
jgi:hypothetical protein